MERVFRGGIQPGTTAYDEVSKAWDKMIKTASFEVFNELAIPGLIYKKKLIRGTDIPTGYPGCEPDGGVWFYNGKLILALEAKKQNNAGNAIERVYKNLYVITKVNPNVSYVVFATGGGIIPGGILHRTLYPMVEGEFNKFFDGGISCFLIDKPIYEEIKETIKDIVLEAIS